MSNAIQRAIIRNYAQARVDEWQPDDAFVIDICETPDGLQKLVMALQDNFSV